MERFNRNYEQLERKLTAVRNNSLQFCWLMSRASNFQSNRTGLSFLSLEHGDWEVKRRR